MTALDLAGNGKAPSRADALARWSRALSVLLFLSSIAALVFQLGWQGALVRRFGDDAELMTILSVVLGLGAGGLIGGLLAPRSPLLLLAAIAAMNGACAYVWPVAGDAADDLLGALGLHHLAVERDHGQRQLAVGRQELALDDVV